MIYIFQGPRKLCAGLAQLKRQIGCRKPGFPKKPLNTFVLLQGGLSLAHICVGIAARKYKDTECKEGDDFVVLGFEKFLDIQVAYAVVSLFFTAYFFKRVWSRIVKLTLSGDPQYKPQELPPADDMKYKMVKIPLKTIRDAFRQIMKYDIVVLVYFLCTVAIAVLSFMAPNSITHASDCPHAEEVRSFGMTYLWMDALYIPVWWFCCPNRKGVVAEIPWPKDALKPGGTVVGTPAASAV